MTTYYKKPNVICPHCDHQYTADEMNEESTVDLWALAPNEEIADLQCPVCDLNFWVKGTYTPLYSTAFAEEML